MDDLPPLSNGDHSLFTLSGLQSKHSVSMSPGRLCGTSRQPEHWWTGRRSSRASLWSPAEDSSEDSVEALGGGGLCVNIKVIRSVVRGCRAVIGYPNMCLGADWIP